MYISLLGAWQMTSDLRLEEVDLHVQTIFKYSENSKQKSAIRFQFDVNAFKYYLFLQNI